LFQNFKIVGLKRISFIKRLGQLLFAFTLILVVSSSVIAQRRQVYNTPTYDLDPLHFGFSLGLNSMDFNIYPSKYLFELDTVYKVNCVPQMGFNIGIVSNLRLGRYFDLRFLPGISFGQRNLEYLIYKDKEFSLKTMQIESTFLEAPLLLKYKAKRLNNYRPYLIGGFTYRLDLSAQKEIKEEEKPKIRIGQHDVYYELGFGVDYYFPFFKFSTEIKYAVGIANIINPDNSEYSRAIEDMFSNMIILSFHFE
jgi:hypothetical protein